MGGGRWIVEVLGSWENEEENMRRGWERSILGGVGVKIEIKVEG